MAWKLIGWSRNKSPYWFKILHIITHTRQWYVPSHFLGWAGDKRVSKTRRLVMNFTTNKFWFAIFNYDRRISTHGIIGECLFQTWISSMLKIFCSFFDKDPLVWDHPRCWSIMQHVLSTWHKTVTWFESVLLHGNSMIAYKCSRRAERYSTRLCFSSFWSSLNLG